MSNPCYQCTHWNGYVGECYLTGKAKDYDQTCKKFKRGKTMSNNSLPCSKCRGQHHPADECVDTAEMSEREKLIEHLMSAEFMSQGIYFDASNETKGYCRWNINKVIDFILADRARMQAKISEARKVLEAVKDSDADVSEEINKALEILICVARIVKPKSNQNQ
jgi:hypothetical protein